MNKYKNYGRFKVLDENSIQFLEKDWHILETFTVCLGFTQTNYSTTSTTSIVATNAEGLKFLCGLPEMSRVLNE